LWYVHAGLLGSYGSSAPTAPGSPCWSVGQLGNLVFDIGSVTRPRPMLGWHSARHRAVFRFEHRRGAPGPVRVAGESRRDSRIKMRTVVRQQQHANVIVHMRASPVRVREVPRQTPRGSLALQTGALRSGAAGGVLKYRPPMGPETFRRSADRSRRTMRTGTRHARAANCILDAPSPECVDIDVKVLACVCRGRRPVLREPNVGPSETSNSGAMRMRRLHRFRPDRS